MPFKDKVKRNEYHRKRMSLKRAEWFASKFCVVCKSKKDLELDHIDPTTKISHKVWGWSEERRLEELAKCQVLCRTHHLEKTVKYFKMLYSLPADRPYIHGTTTAYRRGCRCSVCKYAQSMYKKVRYEEQRKVSQCPQIH